MEIVYLFNAYWVKFARCIVGGPYDTWEDAYKGLEQFIN